MEASGRWRRYRPWLALAGLVLCALVQAAPIVAPLPGATAMLDQTERLRTADHARFVRQLQQLHQEAARLPPVDRWHLRYLDAWETAFDGDYPRANVLLRDIIDHAGDPALVTKATALLMDDMGVISHYEEAFTLANRLVVDLPHVSDPLARFLVLSDLSQLMASAGQYELAIAYARRMEGSLPPGETLCNPRSMQITALMASGKLTSSSPELHQAIEICTTAHQTVFADTMWLVMASLHLEEHRPDQALALLQRIAPAVRTTHYYTHMEALQATLAQAYWQLSDEAHAREAAQAALALGSPGEIDESLRDAYQVLYQIEKKQGDPAAALAYYQQYVEQDKGYLDDVGARAMAFQVVQQQILARRLETEELSKQNSILRLQQTLDAKAVETSRLSIALLLLVLASIGFWLYRLKRSQLRFKRLSHHDGLTGIYNHQHFIGEAARVLHGVEKRHGHACLISIDLDHFKQVNDTHGHAMGDAVLRRAVHICQQHLRPTDLFGRLGGEEFGILLQDCSRDPGVEIANRIRLAIGSAPIEEVGITVSISASVGLACSDTSGYGLQQLCADADAALYRAKRAGRNRVIADPQPDSAPEA